MSRLGREVLATGSRIEIGPAHGARISELRLFLAWHHSGGE